MAQISTFNSMPKFGFIVSLITGSESTQIRLGTPVFDHHLLKVGRRVGVKGATKLLRPSVLTEL